MNAADRRRTRRSRSEPTDWAAPPLQGRRRGPDPGRLGDEGDLLAHAGIANVYSFHLMLSYSRDSFTCFTTSMDLATFWDCHRRAFAHFSGIPGIDLRPDQDRHTRPCCPESGGAAASVGVTAAFAAHYGFTIDVLAACRPTDKGARVEQAEMGYLDFVEPAVGRRPRHQ